MSVSCEKMSTASLSKDIPLSITSPDGVTKVVSILSKSDDSEGENGESDLAFRIALLSDPSDIEGCIHLYAFTNGRMVDDSFFMSMYLKKSSMAVGKEPDFERLLFCLPLSNDNRNSADSFDGHIYIKEHSSEQVTLRFKKAVFKIAQGTYLLNGDLTFMAGDLKDCF
jgi:hypothetical protein